MLSELIIYKFVFLSVQQAGKLLLYYFFINIYLTSSEVYVCRNSIIFTQLVNP
jgi:hypothetical protein